MLKRSSAVLLAVALLFCGEAVQAAPRAWAVFEDGRILPAGMAKGKATCDNSDVVFVFEETINSQTPPVTLTLSEDTAETGQLNVTVTVTLSCGQGEVIFNYQHDSGNLTGADLSIEPLQFSLTVPAQTGASASQSVSYQALDDNNSEGSESASLFRASVAFFIDNVTGQSNQRVDLAQIVIPSNSDNVVDPGDLPADNTDDEEEAIATINTACRMAAEGSDLAETCQAIADALQDSDPATQQQQTQDIADALEPEIVTVQPTAVVAIGRTQFNNLQSRISAVRRGSRGVNVSNLRLTMNGVSLSTGWISRYLAAEDDAGGGSRLLSDKWGFFLNGSINFGEIGASGDDQPGNEFDFYGITGGADYRFDNGLILGGALGYTKFDATLAQGEGEGQSDAWTIQGFGTFGFGDNFYVDGTLGYTMTDFEQFRILDLSSFGGLSNQRLTSGTDIAQISTSLALNYRWVAGNGWTLTPYGSVYYADTETDSFVERGGSLALRYEGYSFDSLLTSLGMRITKVVNTEHGVLTPFADLALERENRTDPFQITTRFLSVDAAGPTISVDEPDRNFASVGAGLVWVFPSGNQMFLRTSTQLGNSGKDLYSLFVGGRFEF